MVAALYFSAPWCGPCKTFGPIMDKVGTDLGIEVEKVNVDEYPEKAGEYGVMSLPTTIWFRDGEFIKFRSGAMSEQTLRGFVSSL